MTEHELKQKWCPHIRGNFDPTKPGIDSNYFADGSWRPTCIGRSCSQFREEEEMIPAGQSTGGIKYNTIVHAYCGLAGKP